MKKQLSLLESKIDIKFKNTDYLRNALVHRSYLNEHKNFTFDQNERLEFLGDAVLELVVTDYLYRNYSEAEGILTNWRSSLVNGERLASVSETLGVYDFMYLSKGESQDGNKKARQYILANVFEAIVGAIYLDQGYEPAAKFINENLIIHLAKIIEDKTYIDAKSMFQERAQEKAGLTPHYRVLDESGPDHNKKFVVGVYIEKELVAKGEGYSKQEAQTQAAAQAIEIKKW
ncbi:MAG: ribonuclease III [Candidatus Komeilibacteria bacterium]|jgi:ribonuclease III|nr:ribonuclease III [Candidatus Komeilibacteria bacterium]MBT4447192.1 ribonuclease III [Candidatus Komeilibacteria bacterium]